MCATNNVTASTKAVIQKELLRAQGVTNDIFAKKATWKQLFEKHTFFTQDYKYYLSIISASRNKLAQQIWSGFVQSRVRRLVGEIENMDTGVEIAHPYVKGFDRVHSCKSEDEFQEILHGEQKYVIKGEKTTESKLQQVMADDGNDISASTDLSKIGPDNQFEDGGKIEVYTTTYYIGLKLREDKVTKKLDISNPVAIFKHGCLEWQQYIPGTNDICTIHVRR